MDRVGIEDDVGTISVELALLLGGVVIPIFIPISVCSSALRFLLSGLPLQTQPQQRHRTPHRTTEKQENANSMS